MKEELRTQLTGALRNPLRGARFLSGRDDDSSFARMVQIYQEGGKITQDEVFQAVAERISEMATTPKLLKDRDNLNDLVHLLQFSEHFRLDETVRDNLLTIINHGRARSNDVDFGSREGWILAWAGVLQPENGDWMPIWRKLWNSDHSDLWRVAYGAMINVADKAEAASCLPTLLERSKADGERYGNLLYRLLQHEISWDSIVQRWTGDGILKRGDLTYAEQVRSLTDPVVKLSGKEDVGRKIRGNTSRLEEALKKNS